MLPYPSPPSYYNNNNINNNTIYDDDTTHNHKPYYNYSTRDGCDTNITITKRVKSKASNSMISAFKNPLKKKECMICVEKRFIKSFVTISKHCDHDSNICYECVNKYIESNLNDKGDINIKCPFVECNVILDNYEIKSLVKKDLYERYDKLTLRKALQQMPDIRWCKNPKCGSAQSHIGSDFEPILTCGDCGTKSCFTHDSLWHDGLTCKQYDEVEKTRNETTRIYLEQHTKPCPKCGVRISKNEGCDHMTCIVFECKYEFCWLCFANYDNIRNHGNHYHGQWCTYYRANEGLS